MSTLVIGVDVGLSGAIAAVRGVELLRLVDMPVVTVQRTHQTRREYLVPELADTLRSLLASVHGATEVRAFVERQQAMPKQGSTSGFRLGVGFGIVRGVLGSLRIPVEIVEPSAWKRAVGLPKGADKGASIELASRLFPDADVARQDGRADALLIARFGQQRLGVARSAAA